ncbi:T9SS type A sorting domain-containing protein [Neolewinella aurantiaca]|uniref:T9SS type A sorting domain-containing protein n=1 Tax=Neolewinella aurantiaca TaxID=2602767 RepID=A0A5C7FPS7_9BACT|nr:T9SS type A sorting domain-containing protein [Neolewinella aurantiaca]TXF87935.1 T9SS type A sorting domain-containing protein [Neolewinella aurantiaca]
MQKLLLFCLAVLFSGVLLAQPIFVDQFDDGNVTITTDQFDITETGGEMVVAGNGTNGAWSGVYFGLPQTYDISASAKLFVRVKSSVLGTTLRMDLTDVNGTGTNIAPITQTLTDNYRVLEFDFSSVDVGEVDLSQIQAIVFFVDPGVGSFTGQVTFDYMALGEEPAGVITSDIYQDHMDSDSSLTSWNGFEVPGFTRERRTGPNGDSTVVTLIGDGTAGPWTPHAYALRPAPEYIQTSVDMSDDPVVYIKVRTSVPGTTLRIDVQDVDNISSTANAITRILTDEWAVYEYELSGASQNFPNESCPTADVDPCIVNLEAVKELIVFVNGGTGQFAGTIDIDWISIGTNLDGDGPEATLEYVDNFDNERIDRTFTVEGISISESGSSLILDGDGTSGEYATVSYLFNEPTDEQDTLRQEITVDFSDDFAQGKLFMRARTIGADQPIRVDIVDTMDLSTNILALTRRITSEWAIYSFDFSGNSGDAGYGGAEGCTPDNPCPIDMTAIKGIFMYPRPGEGMLTGQIEIDWISVGQPLEEVVETAVGVLNYSDTLVGAGEFFTGEPAGISYSVSDDGYLTMTGDGTSGLYEQIQYTLRDEEGNSGKADAAGSGDKLYVRARIRNAASEALRIDLMDEGGFSTTLQGYTNTISGEEFMTYTYDFAQGYTDGGYGGTSCVTGPCDVDPQRITGLNFFIAPGVGGFTGDIDINWISFGQEVSVNVQDFASLNQLHLFPNPATDEMGVEYDLTEASQVSVNLFDGLGRRVLVRDFGTRSAGNNFNRIDVEALPMGTYHLQLIVNGVPARAQTVLKR